MRVSVVATALCLSLVGIAAADDAKAAIEKFTNIPASGLGPALQALAEERDFQVVYLSEVVDSVRTPGVVGQFTIDQALKKLLTGTGLSYRYLDERTVTVYPSSSGRMPTGDPGARRSGREASVLQSDVPSGGSGKGQNGRFWDRFRLAQADQVATSGAENPTSESPRVTLEEIVVSAQKRGEERLIDVPASISVITGDEIEQRGLVNAEDYLRGIPGANQLGDNGTYAGQQIVIRGMETTIRSQNFFAGPTTATYFGETSTTSSGGFHASSVDIKLVDVERVEVLRGPQGTSYGGSALGGAVRTIPVAPRLDAFEAKTAASYSSTENTGGDNYMFQGAVNAPIINGKLAARGVAYVYSDSGYYRNRAGTDPQFQSQMAIPLGAQAFAVDKDNAGASLARGFRFSALYDPTDKLSIGLNYLNQKTEIDGWGLANSGNYDQILFQVAPDNVIRGQTSGVYDSHVEIANAVAQYDLKWADLLATYSYTDSGQLYAAPYGVNQLNWAASYTRENPHYEHSAEIRLGTKLGGPWEGLVGLYYERQLDTSSQHPVVWFGAPAANNVTPGSRSLFEVDIRQKRNQKAVFGELSWEFVPDLTLTGGVRAFWYDRDRYVRNRGVLFGNTESSLRAEDSGQTFKANLSYKPTQDVNLYTQWSQGYRPGTTQTSPPPLLCDRDNDGTVDGTSLRIGDIAEVKSDSVDNYEVGAKAVLLDGRLQIDSAAYIMDWKDIPVSEQLACFAGYTANAGAARSKGIEIQTNFQITESLWLTGGGSMMNARLTELSPTVSALQYRVGDHLPGSPDFTANLGVRYRFNIWRRETFIRADAAHVGEFFTNVRRSEQVRAGDYIKLDLGMQITLDEHAAIDLYVRNLTNEDAFTSRNQTAAGDYFGFRMRPRTAGLQLSYDF